MLSKNLAMLRDLHGLSQEEAAEVVGISRQAYAKWEKGETVPDVESAHCWRNITELRWIRCSISGQSRRA